MQRQLSHSQNFLKSPKLVGKLVERADIAPGDSVVEIGPGRGIITEQLAKRAKRVIAVELDHGLVERLRQRFMETQNVEIIEADFLSWELPHGPYKVFSNIPFNMTADMVRKLLEAPNAPDASYLILQTAAAAKFTATPHGANTQAAILLYPFFDAQIAAKINRHNFWPTPHVDAVLAAFIQRPEPLIESADRQLYRSFVAYGFNQWKPTLAESLASILPAGPLEAVSSLKPSEVPAEQWLALFEAFKKSGTERQRQLLRGTAQRVTANSSSLQKRHRTQPGVRKATRHGARRNGPRFSV